MIKNEKHKNKYRIASSRLQSWDYKWNGAYFITICTHNRAHYFGDINDNKMELSNIGVLADVLLDETKNHTQNVKLGPFVIMPNHVHAILILNNDLTNDGNDHCGGNVVETLHATSLPTNPHNEKMAIISPEKGSISTVIRSYKSAVTRHAHRLGYDFSWQTRFYDHIIRNEKSFNHIREYINTNPQKWDDDKFYTTHNVNL